MKQFITIISLSFFVCLSLSAQKKWSWGIKTQIGVSGEKINETDILDLPTLVRNSTSFKHRTPNLGGGVWLQYRYKKHWAVQSGLQYGSTRSEIGNSNSSILKVTGQQSNYSYNSYGLHIQRLQIPLVLEYHFDVAGLKPYIGSGIVLSRDVSGVIEQKSYDTQVERIFTSVPQDAPSGVRKTGFQYTFSFGLELTDQLAIEVNHLIKKDDWTISWTSEFDHPEGVIICFFPAGMAVKTNYQQQTNFEILYKF